MIKFLIGIGIGLYVATYYDCKPSIEEFIEKIKKCIPVKKTVEENKIWWWKK